VLDVVCNFPSYIAFQCLAVEWRRKVLLGKEIGDQRRKYFCPANFSEINSTSFSTLGLEIQKLHWTSKRFSPLHAAMWCCYVGSCLQTSDVGELMRRSLITSWFPERCGYKTVQTEFWPNSMNPSRHRPKSTIWPCCTLGGEVCLYFSDGLFYVLQNAACLPRICWGIREIQGGPKNWHNKTGTIFCTP